MEFSVRLDGASSNTEFKFSTEALLMCDVSTRVLRNTC